MNVTRHPYSFHGDVVERRGPQMWLWTDGLCIYVREQILGVLRQVGITQEDWMSFGTVVGMRALLDANDYRIPNALEMAVRVIWGKDFDIDSVLEKMEEVEAKGQTGQKTRGSHVLALDRVLGGKAPEHMRALGASVAHNPIAFNTDVEFQFQPVDSQRLLQWASRFGKQEEAVSVLSRLHFERQQSANNRETLLQVVKEVGLDVDAFVAFLDSDELVSEVWRSYGDTQRRHGITSIPVFFFNGPLTNGGPFRDGSESALKVHGSASPEQFLDAFEEVFSRSRASLVKAPPHPAQAPQKSAEVSRCEGPGKTALPAKGMEGSGRAGLKKGFLL